MRVENPYKRNGRGAEYIEVEEVEYHRNGVGGAPFNVIKFTDPKEGPMLGVVFYKVDCSETAVAVFNRDKLAEGDISFGSNSWRGDVYAPMLRVGIALHDFEKHGKKCYHCNAEAGKEVNLKTGSVSCTECGDKEDE
jgi:hypothetical protein